jgi:hypothetical protein
MSGEHGPPHPALGGQVFVIALLVLVVLLPTGLADSSPWGGASPHTTLRTGAAGDPATSGAETRGRVT